MSEEERVNEFWWPPSSGYFSDERPEIVGRTMLAIVSVASTFGFYGTCTVAMRGKRAEWGFWLMFYCYMMLKQVLDDLGVQW